MTLVATALLFLFFFLPLLPGFLLGFRWFLISWPGKLLSWLRAKDYLIFLLPFLWSYVYLFILAPEKKKWFYDLVLTLSLLSLLLSALSLHLARFYLIWGNIPGGNAGFFFLALVALPLSLLRVWVSLSLFFYRSFSLWNFALLQSLLSQPLLFARERPLVRALIHFSSNPTYNHLPPPEFRPSVDRWTKTQVAGGLFIGACGLITGGGLLYYAREQNTLAREQLLQSQQKFLEKARSNDFRELQRGMISEEEYHSRVEKRVTGGIEE